MNLFDIKATEERTLYQQKLWGVKMTVLDKKFYEKQNLLPCVGYCSTFIDRKWEISHKRKLNSENKSRNESYEYDSKNEEFESFDDNIDTCIESEDEEFFLSLPKRAKDSYTEELNDNSGEISLRYWYPRDGLRRVRTELYALMHYLSSSLHMSREQVEGSIVATTNMLFGRE